MAGHAAAAGPPSRDPLDWPFFEERHRTLAAGLDGFIAGGGLGDIDHADADGACRKLVKALGAAGFLKNCVPAAYGGASEAIDSRALCLSRETLAYADGLADFAFAMQGLGTGAISLSGSEELKQRILPKIAAGALIAAFALTEPEAGSDVAAMATAARRDGDAYVLDGEKVFISNGGIADVYTGFARTGEPGMYFIPEVMDRWRAEGRFTDFIAYDRLEAYRDFSGTRIEEDVLVTETGKRILGKPRPRTPEKVEAARGEKGRSCNWLYRLG